MTHTICHVRPHHAQEIADHPSTTIRKNSECMTTRCCGIFCGSDPTLWPKLQALARPDEVWADMSEPGVSDRRAYATALYWSSMTLTTIGCASILSLQNLCGTIAAPAQH